MASQRGSSSYQGMNWIRQEKRLAIYLRDGLACIYCGGTLEDGLTMTLDHVIPYSQGGGNGEWNLVTACLRCNSSRGDRPVEDFAQAVAAYLNHGATAEAIMARINGFRTRPLDVPAAKGIIARRKLVQ